jgi:hypothetical protein
MKFLVQKILVNCSLKLRTNTLSSVLERNGRIAVFSNLDVESLPPAVECILHSIRVINYRRRRYLIKINVLSCKKKRTITGKKNEELGQSSNTVEPHLMSNSSVLRQSFTTCFFSKEYRNHSKLES